MNCISVYQKEVNRPPPKKKYYSSEESIMKDDETLRTMEWTYNRSTMSDDTLFDLYTLDEDGTYRSFRSFRTREDSLPSLDGERARVIRYANARARDKHDQPWDEEDDINTKGGHIGTSTKKGSKARFMSDVEMSSPPRDKSVLDEAPVAMNVQIEIDDEALVDGDETMERLKALSDTVVAAAKENGPKAAATAANAAKAAPEASTESARAAAAAYQIEDDESRDPGCHSEGCTGTDVTRLIHMLRKTVTGGIPEEENSPTTAALVRTFNKLGFFVLSSESQEGDDDLDGTDSSGANITSPPKPLNSLAQAMQSIANKEPTRTYGASEEDRVVGNKATSKPGRLNSSETSAARGVDSGAKVKAADSPPREKKGEKSAASPSHSASPARRLSSTASLSGISFTDTEVVGSHRGDAASVVTPSRNVPPSIRLSPPTNDSNVSVIPELFKSASTISALSPSVNFPHRRSLSFFRTRVGVDDTISEAGDKSQQSTPSPRRPLPPIPPTRSPTTPSSASPSRALYLSSDNDGTELSIVGFSEGNGNENATVVTPPRSTAGSVSSASPGISIKKRFSFMKRKTENSSKDPASADSPRSTMGVDAQIFEEPTDHTSAELFREESIIAISNESIDNHESLVASPPENDKNETSSTDGLLLTESNQAASEYEVQSV